MTVDYEQINNGLIEARAGTRAAECHGFITGFVCVSNDFRTEQLHDHLVSGLEDGQQLEQAYALLDLIAAEVVKSLQTTDIHFRPLLPDDNEEMSLRARALSEWCAGFVSGLGVGGLAETQVTDPVCEEFIRDLVSISRLETDVGDDEESEQSLFELVEYIRVGVLMLYQEWYPDSDIVQRPEVLH